MAGEIVVPSFGESVVEATVGRWLKQEGDPVVPGEAVVELETEKVSTTISADEGGVLARIAYKEGDTVHPGDVLATVEVGAAAGARPAAAKRAEEEGPPGKPAPARAAPPPPKAPAEAPAKAAPEVVARAAPRAEEVEKARVSPAAQRLADELGVDLAQVQGTGPGGRIMKEDVESWVRRAAAAARAPGGAGVPPAPAPRGPAGVPPAAGETPALPGAPPGAAPAPPTEAGRREVRQRFSRRRMTIARRLVEAQHTAAMLTTFNEIDMSAVVELRKRRREEFLASTGVDLGYMSFFVKAVIGALKAYPSVNSELQGDELVLKAYYDIGIAIADPAGLVVPVLRDADRMSFAQVESTISAFVQKARDGTLSLEDLKGGTFTITNGGVFGSLLSTPILNPPQVGILGMHKISERPVAVNGQVVVHPTMYVALSYDHRVVDGREAVLFLVRIKELIEDPERLLLEG